MGPRYKDDSRLRMFNNQHMRRADEIAVFARNGIDHQFQLIIHGDLESIHWNGQSLCVL